MLEGWDIFNLKGGINSSVWGKKTLLYNIRELRNKQIKIGISDFQHNKYWTNLMSYVVLLIFWLPYVLEKWVRMAPLKWEMSQPYKMSIAREIMHNSWWYQN